VARTPEGHVVDVEITDLGMTRLAKMRELVRSLVTAPIETTLDARQLFILEGCSMWSTAPSARMPHRPGGSRTDDRRRLARRTAPSR
jgi:hypothetical protein